MVFEEDGRIQEYVGGYSDWLRRGRQLAEADNPFQKEARKQAAAERKRRQKPTKLSYKDQRELDQLPAEIESIESAIAELQAIVADPGFYSGEQAEIQSTLSDLADAEAKLEARIERWSELEILQESFRS